ncbi:MAG TPA: polysaccharide deacetylase family protein [Microlunatus sp.]|nr:polysaccharide deacetylase family protein [Microlunatus sp.]
MKNPGWIVTGAVAAGVVTGYRLAFGSRSQLFGSFPYAGAVQDQRLALTFDDGPNEPWTSQILDTLRDRRVPGTFFQVGRCAQRHPEVTRRVVDEGHVLGNHSMTHELSGYLRDVDQQAEVVLGRLTLAEIAGVAPRLYRPPWLCHWPWVLRGIAGTGSQVVSGTFVHPFELVQPSAQRLVAGAVRAAAPGAMIIIHDGRESRGGYRGRSAAAVGPIIDELHRRGYSFTTVDQLLGVDAYA